MACVDVCPSKAFRTAGRIADLFDAREVSPSPFHLTVNAVLTHWARGNAPIRDLSEALIYIFEGVVAKLRHKLKVIKRVIFNDHELGRYLNCLIAETQPHSAPSTSSFMISGMPYLPRTVVQLVVLIGTARQKSEDEARLWSLAQAGPRQPTPHTKDDHSSLTVLT
eukprot:CAMPEP_0172599260 /NCGR_PEP_ID=MMETSP1068-20121228/19320_1 /TAXON_ID=35684 /ORGANISM="Pseudopedinella elastica, Strain CCMP716" /LENGTH=165 /DNA_ID=CAMNT_0013399439 /DNA_START=711 /DNA_END=1209 /DNA_ORIENTATION=-